MDKDLHGAHRQAADWLILLRDEPCDATAQARFEAWLDEDPAHARAWVTVSEMFDAIGETSPELEAHWRDTLLPRAGNANAQRSARRLWGRPVSSRFRGPMMAGAVAAAMAFAWLAPDAMLHLRSDHITTAGATDHVTLSDGSQVRLGPDSAIAIDYREGVRTVTLLAGQAWFDVKRDPAAPFRVVAGDVRTTVLGTSFDVRRVGETTAVSVAQGKVRVVDHGVAPASTRILTSGHWLRVDAEHEIESGTSNPALLGSWREGRLVVRNRRISDVIEELRPWYGGRIILLNDAVGRKHIDGVYDARDPANALKAIVSQGGGKVRTITPWLMIAS